MRGLTAVLLVVALPLAAAAQMVVVDIDGFGDYTTIQEGLDAVPDGGTVLVLTSSTSTYHGPLNRDLDFGGKNITLWGFEGAQNTLVDCEGLGRAIHLGAGTDTTTVIKGFTFINGATDGDGGAILCDEGSPVITDCVFTDNTAGYGGAVRLSQGPARIANCDFYGNTAGNAGGGIYTNAEVVTLRGCVFIDNESDDGGGVAAVDGDLTMVKCSVADNRGYYGAGVSLLNSSAVIEQCAIAWNGWGKGVYGSPARSIEVFHCCVFGNGGGDDLPGNAHDNEFVDPLFCDLYNEGGGNVSLCSNSTCLEANNTWSLPVGARAQGCPTCGSPVTNSTWGSVKALFR